MRRQDALTAALTGSLLTCASLPVGKCLKFEGGSFVICNADGSDSQAVTELPADEQGWTLVELDVEEVIIAHKNITSGNTFFSVEGSQKYLQREGNNFIGKAKILSTPMGKIAESLLNDGVKLGVSSRGIGTLSPTKEGYSLVNDDFALATAADIVADPSAPDAFVDGIMEGKDWVWDGGILREKLAERTYKQINTLVDQKKLEENKINLFQNFLSSL